MNEIKFYTCNGLGDRLTQNGTQYVLDLNSDLTQVLSDGTNSYLYGNGPISQTGSVTEYLVSTGSTYHLGDALGSVRQLTDASGEITLAKSYDPYGNVTLSSGNGTSPFAYTGEQQDASSLTYLRARYYSSGDGRFLSRDTWGGDYSNPLSLNRWMYVEGNPVNFVDPTGHIKEKEGIHGDNIAKRLQLKGIYIYKDWGITQVPVHVGRFETYTCGWRIGRWDILDLENIDDAMKDLERALGGSRKIRAAVGQVTINKNFLNGRMMSPPGAWDKFFHGDIIVQNTATSANDPWFKFTIVHEFGHVWDYRWGKRLSLGLMQVTGGWVCSNWAMPNPYCSFDASTIIEHAPDTLKICLDPATSNDSDCKEIYSYSNTGAGAGTENWAQALAYYIYPNYRSGATIGLKSIRRQYVKNQISNLP